MFFSNISSFTLAGVQRTMEKRYALYTILIFAHLIVLTLTLPTSLVEEIKASEQRNNKDKKADDDANATDQTVSENWDDDQAYFRNHNSLMNLPGTLYNSVENLYNDKTIPEYEKGYLYGANKDSLDEALENEVLKNEVLKTELYMEPELNHQYRLKPRLKRNMELTSPEEILALLSMYEENHQRNRLPTNNYRNPWNRLDNTLDMDSNDVQIEDDGNESWLDKPVFPHATNYNTDLDMNYPYGEQNLPRIYEKRGRWGGFTNMRNQRFMVAKKKSVSPTRELRYLNGPNKNDYYTLSQLLSNQREPNLPVVHRQVL